MPYPPFIGSMLPTALPPLVPPPSPHSLLEQQVRYPNQADVVSSWTCLHALDRALSPLVYKLT